MIGNPRSFALLISLIVLGGLLVLAPFDQTAVSRAASADQITILSLYSNDIVYDPSTQKIYASVPANAGPTGNSITSVDPYQNSVGPSDPVGTEPYRLALSEDGRYLYVALRGTATVRRYEIATRTAGLEFALGSDPFFGPYYVEDMAVLPGSPDSVAVSRKKLGYSPRHEGVAIYDNGVQRPEETADHTGSNVLEFSGSAARLYGYNNETTEFGFRRMSVGPSGVAVVDVTRDLISGFGVDFVFDRGLAYTTTGEVIDPERLVRVAAFPGIGYGSLVRPDSGLGRVFFLTGSGATRTLQVFDLGTTGLIGSLEVAGVSGTPSSLIRWGADGLAFRTDAGQLFLIQGPLVDGSPVPTSTATPETTKEPVPSREPTALPTSTPWPTTEPTSEPTAPPTSTPTAIPTNTPTATPTPVVTLHVGGLAGTSATARNSWSASVTVTVHDGGHNPVSGATVTASWSGAYSGPTWCTTEGNGQCQVSVGNLSKKATEIKFTVDRVSKEGMQYRPEDNLEGNGPGASITLKKP